MTAADVVLVIEDEGAMRRFLAQALGSHGFKVIEAGTCAQAIAVATEARPDAILLDLGLPDGDGLDLVRRLRRRGSTLPLSQLLFAHNIVSHTFSQ